MNDPEKENQRNAQPAPPLDAQSPTLTFQAAGLQMLPKAHLLPPTHVQLAGQRLWIVADGVPAAKALAEQLATRQAQVEVLSPAQVGARLQAAKADEIPSGAYLLTALQPEMRGLPSSFDLWLHLRRQLIEPGFDLALALPESAFLIFASAMGTPLGMLGCDTPLAGLVSGFAKALRRERPSQLIKLVDLEPGCQPEAAASLLIAETLADPVHSEVACAQGHRFAVTLSDFPDQPNPPSSFGHQPVFVVSGASGGIVAPILRDLAQTTQGEFFLLSRTPPPGLEAAPPSDPRAQALAETLRAMRSAGARVHYMVCDLTDPLSVQGALKRIASSTDRVDFLIHAAGIDRSRKISRKTPEEVDQVISVKADGFYLLFKGLQAASRLPKSVLFFSSLAARFGNAAQVDYAAGNDLLCKLAMWLPGEFAGMNAAALDWSAWAEVGMASRGIIPRLMEMNGVGMLTPALAAPMVRQALQRKLNGEFVVATRLDEWAAARQVEQPLDGILPAPADSSLAKLWQQGTALKSYSLAKGFTFETVLDPLQESFLNDHRLNGIAILPGAIGLEGFSALARRCTASAGSHSTQPEVVRLEKVRFLAPLKFYADKPQTARWEIKLMLTHEGYLVQAALGSDFLQRGGGKRHFEHFTGELYLSEGASASPAQGEPPTWREQNTLTSADIYRLFFHGPTFQVLEAAQLDADRLLGRFNARLAFQLPPGSNSRLRSLLLELCFQTAGLYQTGVNGVLALPAFVGKVRFNQLGAPQFPLYAEVRPDRRGEGTSFAARVIDQSGQILLEMENYQTAALPYQAEEDKLTPFRRFFASNAGPEGTNPLG